MDVRTKEQLELYLEMRRMNCLVRVIKQPEIHKYIPENDIFKKIKLSYKHIKQICRLQCHVEIRLTYWR